MKGRRTKDEAVSMGASSVLGLRFEINADPSKAEAALKNFEESSGRSMDQLAKGAKTGGQGFDSGLTPAIGRSRGELRRADVAADVLRGQLGIHLPRSMNRMIGESSLIGPALTAAFGVAAVGLFLENLPKIIGGIQTAALELGGFTEENRTLFDLQVKFNQELIQSDPKKLTAEIQRRNQAQGDLRQQLSGSIAEFEKATGVKLKDAETAANLAKVYSNSQPDVAALAQRVVGLTNASDLNDQEIEEHNLTLAKLQEHHKKTAQDFSGAEERQQVFQVIFQGPVYGGQAGIDE